MTRTDDPSRRSPEAPGGLTGTVGIGHLGGVALRAHWTVLIIMALIWAMLAGEVLPAAYRGRPTWQYVLVGGVAAVVFLLGLLAHEGAHAVVARRNGVRVGTVTLWMLGGVTELKSEAETPGAELRIAGAGPLVSLLLGLAFWLLAELARAGGWPVLIAAGLGWLAAINLLLALFNVLPGAPLDGGRLLRAALWKWRGDRAWASIAAARAGRGLGLALVVLGGFDVLFYGDLSGLWLALVGWFLMSAAAAEEQQARVGESLTGVVVGDVMTPDPDTVSPDLTVAEFVAGHLLTYRHSTLPLVEGGRPVGLVTLARLRAVPEGARATTALRAIAWPLSEVTVAAPGDPLAELLPRLNRAADGRVLVLDAGRLVGIVSPVDVTRAIENGRLRQPSSGVAHR